MWFFKKKKEKNKEEINIKIKNINDDLILEEEQPILAEKVENKLSEAKLYEDILINFELINTKNIKITREFYICKIFSRVGLKDVDFNLQVMAIDKNINKLKKDCFTLSRIVDNMRVGIKPDYERLVLVNKQMVDLKAFQQGVFEQLTELNNGSYGHLKISTVSVTLNKNNEELEALYNSISREISTFTSFEEASEYIYYNSGEFIEGIVNRFIECIKETTNEELNNVYNMHYFLPSDAVISLDIKEWIDLYNKLKFVLKQLSKYKTVSYPSCYDLFNSFEAKYAILMMRAERKKK